MSLNRIFALASVSLFALSHPVFASDLADQSNAVNWAGLYAGAQIGMGAVDSKLSGFDENGSDGGGDNDGAWGPRSFPFGHVTAGGYVGYNWVKNDAVFGIEADVNHVTGGSSGGIISEDLYPGPGGVFHISSDWDASIRGRAGFLVNDRTLVYGTAGATLSQFKASGGNEVTSGSFYAIYPNWGNGTDIGGGPRIGWTLGAGMEFALDNNWKLRGEYRHTDYGTARTNYTYDPQGANTPGFVDHRVTEDRVMLGLGYTFSGEPTRRIDRGSGDAMRDWSGFHVGVQTGASASEANFSGFDENGSAGGGDHNGAWGTLSFPFMNILAGGVAGYDQQMGNMVAGVEGDFNKAFGAANASITEDNYPGPGGMWKVRSNYDASLRARLGAVVGGNALVYATGGLAIANYWAQGGEEWSGKDTYYEHNPNWGQGVDIGGGTRLGWTLGGGLEYALDNNLSFKVEYRHSDYGTARLDYIYDPSRANTPGHVDTHITDDRILYGLNYKLGPSGKLASSEDVKRSDWSGFHGGLALGMARNNVSFQGYDPKSNDKIGAWSLDFSVPNASAGGYAGYDKQVGNMVFGVEGDANYVAGASESGRVSEADEPGNGQWNIHNSWNASLRGRAGAVIGNSLVYATGGAAFTQIMANSGFEVSGGNPQTPPWGFGDIGGGTRIGWTLGAGIDYALSAKLTLRTEYRHTDYGNGSTITYNSQGGGTATMASRAIEDRVVLGLGLQF